MENQFFFYSDAPLKMLAEACRLVASTGINVAKARVGPTLRSPLHDGFHHEFQGIALLPGAPAMGVLGSAPGEEGIGVGIVWRWLAPQLVLLSVGHHVF